MQRIVFFVKVFGAFEFDSAKLRRNKFNAKPTTRFFALWKKYNESEDVLVLFSPANTAIFFFR